MEISAVGPGGPGGYEIVDFASAALLRVAEIAIKVGVDKKLWNAGHLACQLVIAERALDSPDVAQLPELKKRIPKLLRELEQVCAWPLRSVVSSRDRATEDRVRKGLVNFSKTSPCVIDQYLKNLKRFSKSVGVADDDNRSTGKANSEGKSTGEEYPAHVNALYTVLESHSLCTCSNPCASGRRRPHARLSLRDDPVKIDGDVAFDMLFSVSLTTLGHRQDLQIRVSMKKKDGKTVKFHDDGSGKAPANDTTRFSVIPTEGGFCRLVKTNLRARICCYVRGLELHQFHDGFPIVQTVAPGPGFSLRQVLGMGRLSNRMKLVLAYIVARSFWQYYDSQWMDSQWTSDLIHFLPETPAEDEVHSKSRGLLYASKPYFVVEFEHDDGKSMEYCDEFGVIYRYPRLLALCIMLLEIGGGQSLTIENRGSIERNLNETWTLAQRLTKKNEKWGDFDYPQYWDAIFGCLALEYAPCSEETLPVEINVSARKARLHEFIVQPLEKLLRDLGFMENFHIMRPIDLPTTWPVADMPAAPALPTQSPDVGQSTRCLEEVNFIPTQSTDVCQSIRWLEKVNDINRYIQEMRSSPSAQAPRVAVLDTGFDREAVFFTLPGRMQMIQGWRDWVDASETPVDENGHGSHTLALVMKVAPNAIIYAARIAKNRESLKNATQVIVEAINWAANDVKADIVSMSFGFQYEESSVTQAITQAILDRKGKIIFLAAASNSGGNGREMFPAKLNSVISIRATNSHGAFSDRNPPVHRDEAAVFGTLGHMVPSAWLSNVNGEVVKSGSSVATAIAAGIAAMVLTFVIAAMEDQKFPVSAKVHRVWMRQGMEAVLKRMSQEMGKRSYFISPIEFFDGEDAAMGSWTAIADACRRWT